MCCRIASSGAPCPYSGGGPLRRECSRRQPRIPARRPSSADSPMRRLLAALVASAWICSANGEGLSAARLGVLYNLDDPSSAEVAHFYATRRSIPPANVVGIHLGHARALAPEFLAQVRKQALDAMPGVVQSL